MRLIPRVPPLLRRTLLPLLLSLPILLAACSREEETAPAQPPLPAYTAFGPPEAVRIDEYEGDAMQPFLSPDGRFLLYNNRIDPRDDTNLFVAERIDDLHFHGLGEMVGVNTPSLDSSASLDLDNRLYFITGRSYAQDYSTVYRGHFDDGVVSGIEPAPGVSEHRPGRLSFDATISADGNTLLLVDGHLGPGSLPDAAEIVMAVRDGEQFRRLGQQESPLAAINTPGTLNYAPVLSRDGLELFFTRLVPAERLQEPHILRSVRASLQAPFQAPQQIAAIDGYAESPTLSPDGRSLYFARRDKTSFAIYRVRRP